MCAWERYDVYLSVQIYTKHAGYCVKRSASIAQVGSVFYQLYYGRCIELCHQNMLRHLFSYLVFKGCTPDCSLCGHDADVLFLCQPYSLFQGRPDANDRQVRYSSPDIIKHLNRWSIRCNHDKLWLVSFQVLYCVYNYFPKLLGGFVSIWKMCPVCKVQKVFRVYLSS